MKQTIVSVKGREILDSRGNPTVEAEVRLECGISARAAVPSGASTGKFEAHELRQSEDKRYFGKGTENAAENINNAISPSVIGESCLEQMKIDFLLNSLDGTENKSKLGANALLAVSLASARAGAKCLEIPLYRYIGGVYAHTMPVPMMNILNGGAHSDNNVDIQEFMIMPVGASCFKEALRQCAEIYHTLGEIIKSRNLSTAVGDEGGFAPNLSNDEEALELIIEAISKAGYSTDNTKLAVDAAASEWYDGGEYVLPKRKIRYKSSELIKYWQKLTEDYPIISLEDPLSEDDWQGFKNITEKIGVKEQIVGDDLFVTNAMRLKTGIKESAANAVLVKMNQIGTLTQTLETVELAKRAGYNTIISHRSGETEDTFIADLAVALNAGQIKTGAPCRTERTAKYNRLLRIEESLMKTAEYGNTD